MENKEIWKDVNGYEGLYQISNLGNIKSLDREVLRHPSKMKIKGKMLNPTDFKEYRRITISKDNVFKSFLIHRLVAEHFLPKDELKDVVNHKDGIKHNNSVSNLEWCTSSENTLHAFDLNLSSNKGSKNPKTTLKEEDVIKIRELHNNGVSYKDISEKFSINKNIISKIVRRITWVHI